MRPVEELDKLRRSYPAFVRLAEALSLSAVVDPTFLRQMRLKLVPRADVGTEADIWFSSFVDTANVQGFTFRPDSAEELWSVFQNDQNWLETVRAATQSFHSHLPPITKITEELIWLGLVSWLPDKNERIDDLLRQITVALVREERKPLARWAVRTLPRLPKSIARFESFERLAVAAVARVPGAKPILSIVSSSSFNDWLPSIILPETPTLDVGVRRLRRGITLLAGSTKGDYCIRIPHVPPLVLALSETGPADSSPKMVWLTQGKTRNVTIGPQRLWLKTANGDVYELPALSEKLDSKKRDFRFADAPPDVDIHLPGVSHYSHGINIAVESENATRIDLCVFDGRTEVTRLPLPRRSGRVWHGYMPDLTDELIYGFRAHGPYDPEKGLRFNSNKLLMDPYAKGHASRFAWTEAHLGYEVGSPKEDLSFSRKDNSAFTLLSRSVKKTPTPRALKERIPWDRTVLYQVNVRGMTMIHPLVSEKDRGSYSGLASRAVLDHLQHLGVTSLLISPVLEFIDPQYLAERNLRDYWGENPIAFCAPTSRHAKLDPIAEYKEMIETFHDHGFEIIMSVDYSHTAEGNHLGPTLSWRGIDNASYYRLNENRRYYDDNTGTGNSFNLQRPLGRRLVMDSLKYWAKDFGVDGFFFRLGTTLARTDQGFDVSEDSILHAIRYEPTLANLKLLAEPWDVGLSGYQVGTFPPGWSQLNDRYRSALRGFWNGERDLAGQVASCMMASPNVFQRNGHQTNASVNYVVEQHGFTLADLYSYNDKHNEANGEDNRDGPSDERSNNCGHEGPTDDPIIKALRRRLRRNQLACLMLAKGIPMLLAGDEVSNSQGGNNNAYCQDNEIGWVGWESLRTSEDLSGYLSQLISLRQEFSQIGAGPWVDVNDKSAPRVRWIGRNGSEMTEEDWKDAGGFLSYILADARGLKPLYVVMNAEDQPLSVICPRGDLAALWKVRIDTSAENGSRDSLLRPGEKFPVGPRSLMVFESGGSPSVA